MLRKETRSDGPGGTGAKLENLRALPGTRALRAIRCRRHIACCDAPWRPFRPRSLGEPRSGSFGARALDGPNGASGEGEAGRKLIDRAEGAEHGAGSELRTGNHLARRVGRGKHDIVRRRHLVEFSHRAP